MWQLDFVQCMNRFDRVVAYIHRMPNAFDARAEKMDHYKRYMETPMNTSNISMSQLVEEEENLVLCKSFFFFSES